jgi:signal transduction histidine kinase
LRAEAKALRFEVLVDGNFVPYVLADEVKIRQILINLIGNAIKFTERGEIQLHVRLDQRSTEQLWLVARIADTGPGITDEDQKKLFRPFSHARRSLNTEGGTGLGLAISRQYARLMGVTSRLPAALAKVPYPISRSRLFVATRQSLSGGILPAALQAYVPEQRFPGY